MNGEINDNWYCTAFDNFAGYCDHEGFYPEKCDGKCEQHHRKHPTPEQFEEEYGEKYPDDGAVYVYCAGKFPYWVILTKKEYDELEPEFKEGVVCACTPWGKPPDDWRPE